MSEGKFYGNKFFKELSSGSYISAKNIVPEIIRLTKPNSIIDVGCGMGAWLKAFSENGINDFVGIDGEYVNENELLISKEKFIRHDLKNPVELNKKFDLCVSLEVAEHLPASSAEAFVESLIKLSDVIVFSAAIPNQLGTYHINEQYPEYWANIFFNKGYIASDCLRPRFWNDENICYWFKQNMLVFINKNIIDKYPEIQKYSLTTNKDYLTKIHPGIFRHKQFLRWGHYTLNTFAKIFGSKSSY
ncbi:MAG: methyltransferase domain-containing protein [Bacteroidota bacterium]